MKKFLVLALCLLLVVALSSVAVAGAKAKIRYSHWGDPAEAKAHLELIQEFMEKNPDIEVVDVHIPTQYEDKIQVEMAGGVAPDVMFFQDEPFPGFVRRGVFENLHNRIMADKTIDINDWWPGSNEYFLYKGQHWTLAAEGGPSSTVIYNIDHFEKAGVRKPWDEWTYMDFLETAKKLTRDTNGDGKIDQFGFNISTWWPRSLAWIKTFGGAFMVVHDPDNKEIVTSEAGSSETISSFRFLQDLRWKHNVMPSPAQMEALGPSIFQTGKISIIEDGPWTLPTNRAAKESQGLRFDMAQVPTGPKGIKAARQSFDTWVMYSGSKNKDAAWRFISFLFGPSGQRKFAELGRAIPARKSIAYTDAFMRPDTPEREEVFLKVMETAAFPQPTSAYWYQADPLIAEWFDKLWLNKITPEEAGMGMEKAVNEIVKKGWPGGVKPTMR